MLTTDAMLAGRRAYVVVVVTTDAAGVGESKGSYNPSLH